MPPSFPTATGWRFLWIRKRLAALAPDAANFPNLRHPPFFADLELDGARRPELRLEGFIGGRHVLTRLFSSDPAHDRIFLQADDAALAGDGADATRIVFGQVDKFGAPRAFAEGQVSFKVEGPGRIVGDNPFLLTDAGGMGAVWIKTAVGGVGHIQVTATHSLLGARSVRIKVTRSAA